LSTHNLQQSVCSRLALRMERINAVEKHSLGVARLGACVCEADQRIWPEAHIVSPAKPLVPKNPAAGVPLRNLEVGAIADGVTARLLESSDRRPVGYFCTRPPVYGPSRGREVAFSGLPGKLSEEGL